MTFRFCLVLDPLILLRLMLIYQIDGQNVDFGVISLFHLRFCQCIPVEYVDISRLLRRPQRRASHMRPWPVLRYAMLLTHEILLSTPFNIFCCNVRMIQSGFIQIKSLLFSEVFEHVVLLDVECHLPDPC